MFRLEHASLDKAKAVSLEPTIKNLQDLNEVWKDDYSANSALRSNLRKEKQEIQAEKVRFYPIRKKSKILKRNTVLIKVYLFCRKMSKIQMWLN